MKTATKKNPASKTATAREELIQRLLAKAALDFKCCGHGHLKGSAN